MPIIHLTDRTIAGLAPAPGAARTDYFDRTLPGFGVRVGPHRKTFVVMYRTRQTRRFRRQSLDTYPTMTLATAREHAQAVLRKADVGRDPATEQRTARTQTFGALAELYLQRWAMTKKRSWRDDARMIRNELSPADRSLTFPNSEELASLLHPDALGELPCEFSSGTVHFSNLSNLPWSPLRILLSSLWRCSVIGRIVLAVAVLGFHLPAHAAAITIGGAALLDEGQVSTVAGTTTVNFNALASGTQTFVTGLATYTNANIFDCACAGDGDLKNDTSKGARAFGSNFGAEQTFEVAFAQPLDYFGFYWGSPDPDNVVTFFNGATQLFAFTGVQLNALGVGFGTGSAAFVNFAAVGSERFTRVVFKPGQFLIETDNHAYRVAPVPEPASVLLVGVGLTWVVSRRRRQVR